MQRSQVYTGNMQPMSDPDLELLRGSLLEAAEALSRLAREPGPGGLELAAAVTQAVSELNGQVNALLLGLAARPVEPMDEAYLRYLKDLVRLRAGVMELEQLLLDRAAFERAREEWLGLTVLLDRTLEPLIDLMTFADPSQPEADLSRGYSFDSETLGFTRVRFKPR
ncbi:hypothetical protein Mlute_00111 [Meiothermus luteus]|jgi:hypothetical protein|nr:hypothetical protein Mrub_0539 [Meiothermus ruber DSM 1279]RIH90189.1 hypothetical protein Mlute_00111 [Meiothermus luteus]